MLNETNYEIIIHKFSENNQGIYEAQDPDGLKQTFIISYYC